MNSCCIFSHVIPVMSSSSYHNRAEPSRVSLNLLRILLSEMLCLSFQSSTSKMCESGFLSLSPLNDGLCFSDCWSDRVSMHFCICSSFSRCLLYWMIFRFSSSVFAGSVSLSQGSSSSYGYFNSSISSLLPAILIFLVRSLVTLSSSSLLSGFIIASDGVSKPSGLPDLLLEGDGVLGWLLAVSCC